MASGVGGERGDGVTQLERLRGVVRDTPATPAAMSGYLEKVRGHAYRVTDADVQALKDAGLSEDEIFEQTVAAAISEGFRRLDAAEAVL